MFKPLVVLSKRNFVPKLISAKQKILIIKEKYTRSLHKKTN